jgi:hypothetical protein
MLNNIVEKFTIATVLHNQVQLSLGFNNLRKQINEKYGKLTS